MELLDSVKVFRDSVYRNIKHPVTNAAALFDDLAEDAGSQGVGVVHSGIRTGHTEVINLPFRPGIGYPTPFPITRFSNGDYGVFYSSLQPITTIYETVFHFVAFSRTLPIPASGIFVSRRQIFELDTNALMINLNGKEPGFPDLIHPNNYTFTNQLGLYLWQHGADGLYTRSARSTGMNASFFKPGWISNPRPVDELIYRWPMGHLDVSIERNGSVVLSVPT